MSWFDFLFKPVFSSNSASKTHKTFILEPILTPSGIVDSLDDGPDFDGDSQENPVENTESDLDDQPIENLPVNTTEESDILPEIPDEDLEEVPFIYALGEETDAETQEESLEPTSTEQDLALILDSETQLDGEITQEPVDSVKADVKPDVNPENSPVLAVAEVEGDGEITQERAELTTDTEGDEALLDDLLPVEITEKEVAQPKFDSGYFVVGETGEIEVDYLFDGGKYQGELGIFSLDGMDEYDPDTEDFIAEAARRSNSNSELGHIIISDRTEGARFSGELGETDQNSGEYQGIKTFNMRSGDTFGMMLVPKGSIEKVVDNPGIGGAARPLFSLSTANPEDSFHMGQIADVTGDGNTFVFEDLRVDGKSDGDYNDLIFRVKGATGKAAQLDDVINTAKEWRNSDLGRELVAYVTGDDTAVAEIDDLDLENIPQTDTPVEENSETQSAADLTKTEVTEHENNANPAVEDNSETQSAADLTKTDITEHENNANPAVEDNSESKTQPIDLKPGEFIVGETGEITVDFLFDGGGYKGEVAIFSLEGLEDLDPNSAEFRAEVLQRITDDSDLGKIVISDRTEGAKFSGELGEIDRNSGDYAGPKTVQMTPGEKFGVVLAPKGNIEQALENPNKPLMFSLGSQQLADATGEGQTFAWEDLDVEKNSDKDYNDLIFRVKGATGKAEHIDDVIDSEKVWQDTPLGQAILDYGKPETQLGSADRLYNPTEPVIIQGKITDPDGINQIGKVEIFLQKDGGEWIDVTEEVEIKTTSDYQKISYQKEGLEPGHYQLQIVAQDSAGKVSEPTVEQFTVLSVGKGEELSDRVKFAIEKATNLGSYEPEQLAGVQQWIVSVQNGEGSPELASQFGATNLGETGHIPHTYIWEFPENLTAQEVAEKLGSEYKVEFAYPLVEYQVNWNSPSNEPLVKNGDQWHLTQSGLPEVWNNQNIQGSGVVIGVVDSGFEIDDPTKGLQGHPDLLPNYRKDLSYDFDEQDAYPSRQVDYELETNLSKPIVNPIGTPIKHEFKLRSVNDSIINSLAINLDIRHPNVSNLEAFLVSPQGMIVPLPNLQTQSYSLSLPEFQNYSAQGEWKLEIINNSTKLESGVLRNWSLDFVTNHLHGTAVAGIAAASGDNQLGGSGVAPEAEWAGLRMGADGTTDIEVAAALSHNRQEIDIYNNSWGIGFFNTLPNGEYAMEQSALLGREGDGSIPVFAAGNGAGAGGNVNYNSFANSPYAIAVAAIDSEGKHKHATYSEPGASLLVSAYSSGAPDKNIVTTGFYPEGNPEKDYYINNFGGTSAAAPFVSGVVALMLEANPDLTLRDVQHILAKTADQNDPTHEGWATNGAGYHVNHQYGFGAVNPDAAVTMAKTWQPVAELETIEEYSYLGRRIPDANKNHIPTKPVTDSISIPSNPEKDLTLEWVEVEFSGNHRYHGDLEIVLEHEYINEQGEKVTTSSILAEQHRNDKYLPNSAENNQYYWLFSSARHWGESSEGTWTLKVIDKFYSPSSIHKEGDPSQWNVFTDWTLRLHGTNPNAVPKPKVTISSLDKGATEEGNAAQFLVTRTGDTDEALTVNYTLRGSAKNGEDYQTLTGTVTIPAGRETATIPVVPLYDYALEGAETVEIELQAASGYQLDGVVTATATIADSKTTSRYGPFVYVNPQNGHQYILSQPDTWLGAQEQAQALGGNLVSINSQAENDWLVKTFGKTMFSIGLTDSEIYGQKEGDFAWVNGDEVNYTNWKPGEPNNIIAGNEDFAVINQHVTGQWNDRVETADYPGIIEIDPSTLEKPIVNVMVTDDEAGEDGNAGQIVITRVGDLTKELTVNYSVAGDATNGIDIAKLSGEITIPAGESLVTLPILALYDGVFQEGEEKAIIKLSSNENYAIGTYGTGEVKIKDNHKPSEPTIYTNPVTGSKYFLTTPDTWLGAQEQAKAAGGNLVSINSQAENDWLYKTFGRGRKWIGLNDSEIYGNTEGNHRWVNGDQLTFTPNRFGKDNVQRTAEGEDFYETNFMEPGGWNDMPHNLPSVLGGNWQNPVGIVEIPGTPEPIPDNAWIRQLGTEGSDRTSGVTVDDFGNVYVVGTTDGNLDGENAGQEDAFVAKYDVDGNLLWKKQLGTVAIDETRGITVDQTGKVYITGHTFGDLGSENQGLSDVFILKLDADGQELLQKQIGSSSDDYATSITVDETGNIYLSGFTGGNLQGNNAGGYDPWVAKYDANGEPIWSDQFATSSHEGAIDLAIDSSGNTYLIGHTYGALGGENAGSQDAFIIKYNAQGVKEWQKQLGTAQYEEGHSLAIDSEDNIYITGNTQGSLGGENQGLQDIFITKLNPQGDELWKQQFGSISEDSASRLAIDQNDVIHVAGFTTNTLNGETITGGQDAFLMLVDKEGQHLETQVLGTVNNDTAQDIAIDRSGNFYLTGYTEGNLAAENAGGKDFWVSKNQVPKAGYNWTWTYFGEDLHTQGNTVRLESTPNTDAAKADFLANLDNIETVDFENFNHGDKPTVLDFGSTQATVTGYSIVRDVPTATDGGMFPTSGDNFLQSSDDTEFTIEFDRPQSAFGFTTTDAEGGPFTLTLHYKDGTTSELTIPLQGTWPANSGSALFYGITDIYQPFSRVTIHKPAGTERIGLDDLVIGDIKPDVLLKTSTPPNQTLHLAYHEDTPLDLSNIIVTDPDGEAKVKLTLSETDAGKLSTATSGTVTSTYDPETGVWTAEGAVNHLNQLLADLEFKPTANSAESVTIATEIIVQSGLVLTGTIQLTGLPKNDDPTIQVEPTQEWVQQLGSTGYDALGAVATDAQGNVFIAGWVRGDIDGNKYKGGTGLPGSYGDGFLTKYDRDGNKLWTTTLGSADDDGFNGVDTDSQGNAYVVGTTLGSLGGQHLGKTDAFFGKYDGEGNLIWSRQIGTSEDDTLAKLIVDKEDNIYTVGATAGILEGTNSHHGYDALIQKWDSDGNLLWTRQITSTQASSSSAVDVTLDEATGDLLLTGNAAGNLDGQTLVGNWDVMVARYDKDGNKIWERQFGTTEEDVGRAIDTDSEGNIYVSGMVTEALEGETHEGARDAFVAKLGKDGNLIWTKQFAQNGSTDPNYQGNDHAYGIGVDNNDQVYVTGHVDGSLDGNPHAGSIDAFITGLDTNGNRSWSQQFGFPGWDVLHQIEIDEDNNLFIAGSVMGAMPGQTYNGSTDPIVAKYSFNQTYQENTPVELNNIYINDEDTNETLTVTLALSDTNAGTLTSNTSNSAETTFANGTLTVTGTAQDVNEILQDLHFNPANGYTETVTIDTSVTDGKNNPVTGATITLKGNTPSNL